MSHWVIYKHQCFICYCSDSWEQHKAPAESVAGKCPFLIWGLFCAFLHSGRMLVKIKHHDQEQLGEEKGLIQLTLPHHSSSLKEVKAGTQHRNLEAGTYTESMEEHCLLTRSLCFAQPTFLYNPGMAPSTFITNKNNNNNNENTLQAFLQASLVEVFFSMDVPCSQKPLPCVK